jgi:hypothetical protein
LTASKTQAERGFIAAETAALQIYVQTGGNARFPLDSGVPSVYNNIVPENRNDGGGKPYGQE